MAIEILERRSGDETNRYDVVTCRFEHSACLLVGKMLRGSTATETAAFQTERWIGNAIQHNSLPKLEGEFILEDRPTLAYRLIDGKNLAGWMSERAQQPMKAELGDLLTQLVGAVRSLHQVGLVHGNIHPEHLLISPAGNLYLIGLGGCSAVGSDLTVLPAAKKTANNKTDTFTAPELLPGTRLANEAIETCSSADIYSIGMIIQKLFPEFAEACRVDLLCGDQDGRLTSSELLQILESTPRFRAAG